MRQSCGKTHLIRTRRTQPGAFTRPAAVRARKPAPLLLAAGLFGRKSGKVVGSSAGHNRLGGLDDSRRKAAPFVRKKWLGVIRAANVEGQ